VDGETKGYRGRGGERRVGSREKGRVGRKGKKGMGVDGGYRRQGKGKEGEREVKGCKFNNLRMSVDVPNKRNGKPSRAVIRATVAAREESFGFKMYFIIVEPLVPADLLFLCMYCCLHHQSLNQTHASLSPSGH